MGEAQGEQGSWEPGVRAMVDTRTWTLMHGRSRRGEEQGGSHLADEKTDKDPSGKFHSRRVSGEAGRWAVTWKSVGIKLRCLSFSALSRVIMWFILLLFEALPELVSAQGKCRLSVPAASSDQRAWRGLEFFIQDSCNSNLSARLC